MAAAQLHAAKIHLTQKILGSTALMAMNIVNHAKTGSTTITIAMQKALLEPGVRSKPIEARAGVARFLL